MSKFRVIFCTLLLLSGIFIVSEPSEIIPFIIFCFLVYVVTFGLWDLFREKGFLKTLGVLMLVVIFLIFANAGKITETLKEITERIKLEETVNKELTPDTNKK
jgi:hypothetical protein